MASNPWGAAAQSYGQDLDQLGKIQMGGMQQAAQMPLQLYDRFMSGYQNARAMAMQREEQDRKNQLADLQNKKLQYEMDEHERARQETEHLNAAYTASIESKPDGTTSVNPNKLMNNLAAANKGSLVPKATESVYKAQEAAQKLETERTNNYTKAQTTLTDALKGYLLSGAPITDEGIAQVTKTVGMTSDHHKNAAQEFIQSTGITPDMPPEQKAAAFTNAIKARVYGQLPADKTLPQSSVVDAGGVKQQYLTDPVTGKMTQGQNLGQTAESGVGKLKQDLQAGRITQQEYDLELKKMTNIPVTQVQVLAGMSKGDEGEQAARMLAKKIRSGMPLGVEARANPFVFARAQQIAANKNDDLADVVDLARANQEFKQNLTNLQDWEGKGLGRQQVTSINTIGQHFKTLRRVADALKSGDIQIANRFLQEAGIQTGSTPEAVYDNVINFLAPETDNVLSGGHRTVEGVTSLKSGWKRQYSAKQLGDVLDTTQEMIGGRLNSLNNDFVRTSRGKDLISSGRVIGPAAEHLGRYISKAPTDQGGDFSVSYNGKTYKFPNQKALDGFKSEVGIQ